MVNADIVSLPYMINPPSTLPEIMGEVYVEEVIRIYINRFN